MKDLSDWKAKAGLVLKTEESAAFFSPILMRFDNAVFYDLLVNMGEYLETQHPYAFGDLLHIVDNAHRVMLQEQAKNAAKTAQGDPDVLIQFPKAKGVK
jgi:hypothetical protein